MKPASWWGAGQETFLREVCGDDDDLRRQVEQLLKADAEAGSFLADGAAEDETRASHGPAHADATHTARPMAESEGDTIGRYRLLQKIGEGGFGVVWLAEQREPVKRRVALKIIKLGMDTRQVITRFEAERQALALMDHPGIAKVYDAGATDTGRPYFVMELVKGVPITQFCDDEQLSAAQRLNLFRQVCHAVQHAHQKGIIHRDIKPSNVLVTMHDDVPLPKVIDFGIAKATSAELTEKTLFTEHGQFIGTPAYMAPEQAEARGLDVDTRADIYSLGVLLYELLTGEPPFDHQRLRSAGFAEMVRIIREEEPPRPSTRISRISRSRGSVPERRLSRLSRGDLDWIVMKCLEKSRTRRYETAHDLAVDIQRHLDSEPVHASPPSAVYRLRKFVRRNRGPVLAGALVALALMAGLVGTTTFAIRESRAHRSEAQQRRLAEQNQQTAERIQWFLQRMLESVTPEQARGRDTTLLREVLDQAARGANDELADQPEVLAAVSNTIGLTYLGLGQYDEAEKHLSAALEIQRRLFGEEHLGVADTLSSLGTLKTHTADYATAGALLEEALAIKRKLLGDDDPRLYVTLNNLANVLDDLDRLDEAEQLHRQILTYRQRTLGNDHPDVAVTLNNLAFLLMKKGAYTDAEAMFRHALEMRRRLYGDDHPDVALSYVNLGHLLMTMGRFADADPCLRKALELRRRLSGDEHPDTAYALNNLAANCHKQGDYTAAEALYKEALPILRRAFGDDDWRVTRMMTSLATGLRLQGKHAEAEAIYRDLLSRHRQSGDTTATIKTLDWLGQLQQAQGKLDEAEATMRECLALRREQLPASDPNIVHSLLALGNVQAEQRRFTEAEEHLLAARTICTQTDEPAEGMTRAVLKALVALYSDWHEAEPGGRHDDAATRWQAELTRLESAAQTSESQPADGD